LNSRWTVVGRSCGRRHGRPLAVDGLELEHPIPVDDQQSAGAEAAAVHVDVDGILRGAVEV
jgi:hypothetical protein